MRPFCYFYTARSSLNFASTPSTTTSHKLGAGPIIGIVVGVILLIFALGCCLCLRRRKSKKRQGHKKRSPTPHTSEVLPLHHTAYPEESYVHNIPKYPSTPSMASVYDTNKPLLPETPPAVEIYDISSFSSLATDSTTVNTATGGPDKKAKKGAKKVSITQKSPVNTVIYHCFSLHRLVPKL